MKTEKQKKDVPFHWDCIGDIQVGRENLGAEMPVVVYRLFEYTMREVLTERLGEQACISMLRESGKRAGIAFAKQYLDLTVPFSSYIAMVQKTMIDLKIGILRIEEVKADGTILLTVSEDLDCSGMPVTGEAVCNYDEGFIQGILFSYDGKSYDVLEIDCWAKGDRVCRFQVTTQE